MSLKSVSTWSLHHTLGSYVAEDSEVAMGMATPAGRPAGLDLLDLPAELAARGFDTIQICHFHLPSRDAGYLAELRAALTAARLHLDCLLVDAGDLTDPHEADRHQRWIGGWLTDAAALGAQRVRVIAGKSPPTPERLATSTDRLRRLAEDHPEVRVVTENWFALLPDAASVHALLDRMEGTVGFLVDLGNWTGPDTYDQLSAVAGLAETCHAKAHHVGHRMDVEDYRRKLSVLRDASFAGPLALVYDGPDRDEWAGLEREHEVTLAVFAADRPV